MRKKYYKKELREEFFNEMSEKSHGTCMICAKPTKYLVIDHDHVNGYMRGILCQACNGGLGHFKDSPQILKSAMDYLEDYLILSNIVISPKNYDKKVNIEDTIKELILDQSYISDRARAKELAVRFAEFSEGACQTRVSRFRMAEKKKSESL